MSSGIVIRSIGGNLYQVARIKGWQKHIPGTYSPSVPISPQLYHHSWLSHCFSIVKSSYIPSTSPWNIRVILLLVIFPLYHSYIPCVPNSHIFPIFSHSFPLSSASSNIFLHHIFWSFPNILPDFLHLPHIFPELSSILPGRFPLYSFPSFPHGSPPRPGRRPRLPPGRFERHRLRSGAGLGRLGGGLCSAAAGRAQHTGGGEMGWVMLGPWGCLEVVFFTIFFIFCGGVGGFWRICLEVHGILWDCFLFCWLGLGMGDSGMVSVLG